MRYRIGIAIVGMAMAAVSGSALAQDRTLVRDRVKVDDLNLNSPAGQRTARDRIDSAARRTCADAGGLGVQGDRDREQCRAEVRTSGAAGVGQIQSRQQLAEQRRWAAQRASARRPARHHAAARRPSAQRYQHCTWPKRYAYKKRVCVWRNRR